MFLVIYGPTGVGKTEISHIIAQNMPIEIINMDVGQFYTPFTIGTAKPTKKEMGIVPHHLFNIISHPKDYSISTYQTQVSQLIDRIIKRNNIPVLVGGSGFYLQSLLFPPSITTNTLSTDNMCKKSITWDHLNVIDPDRAKKIKPNDIYRIERAIAIYYKTGNKPSSYKPLYNPLSDYKILFINRDRKELYSRINQRVDQMMYNGWLKEVIAIMGTEWEKFVLQKKLIGYNELILFLQEGSPEKQYKSMINSIKKRTRNYAKRQLTFWRMLKKQITNFAPEKSIDLHEINITLLEKEKYKTTLLHNHPMIKSILQEITKCIIKKDTHA